ncbi:hypothetical protein D9M72_443840 [compost metagenome]
MTFREFGRLVAVGVLSHHVVGGRRGVGEHHRRFALGEEAIGFRPAGGDGQNTVLELRPGSTRLVAIDRLDPKQQSEARRRGARVLDDDLLRRVAFDQFLEALRRCLQRLGVVDDGEMAVVIGQEGVVGEVAGHLQVLRFDAMRCEEARCLCFRHEVGVETEHDVGLRGSTLEL